MKIKNKKDLILGIASLLISAWIIYISFTMLGDSRYDGDPGPRMFPLIGAAIMLVCSIIILIKPDPESKQFMTKQQWLNAAKIFGVYCLTALLFKLIGFGATVPIITFILTLLMSKQSMPDATLKKRIIISVIYAIILGICIYLIYVVGLKARLPKGIVENLLK